MVLLMTNNHVSISSHVKGNGSNDESNCEITERMLQVKEQEEGRVMRTLVLVFISTYRRPIGPRTSEEIKQKRGGPTGRDSVMGVLLQDEEADVAMAEDL